MLSQFKIITVSFLLISSLAISSALRAENLIRTDGVALITSKLDKNLYRTRAIENALQNLASQGAQTLDSFSIVENGQVLMDQVHLASKLGIQQYTVVKEGIKGELYHVSLNVIVDDKHKKKKNNLCRKAIPPSLDFSIILKKNYNKMPAWVVFSDKFIDQEIANYDFKPALHKTASEGYKRIKDSSFYSLHEKNNSPIKPENYYKLQASVVLDSIHKSDLLGKSLSIKVTVFSHIFRKEKKILEQKVVNQFVIMDTNFDGLISPVTRKNWPSTKKNIANFILKTLEQQLTQLNCLEFFPKIHERAGSTYLDYGSLDGITSSDMFLLKNSDAKKIYFRLESLDEYQTKIKIISMVELPEELLGSEVEVVSGS